MLTRSAQDVYGKLFQTGKENDDWSCPSTLCVGSAQPSPLARISHQREPCFPPYTFVTWVTPLLSRSHTKVPYRFSSLSCLI